VRRFSSRTLKRAKKSHKELDARLAFEKMTPMPRRAVQSTKVSIVIHANQMTLIEGIRRGGMLGDTLADVARQLLGRGLEVEITKPFYTGLLEHLKRTALPERAKTELSQSQAFQTATKKQMKENG
jgi:hypothetical protein